MDWRRTISKSKSLSHIRDFEIDPDLILDNISRLVMLIGLDGIILYWNGGGESVFGYSAEEITGKSVQTLYPGRDRKSFIEELGRMQNGEIVSGEWRGRHKNGSVVWVDVKRTLIEDTGGNMVILGTASDISSQKKTEYELLEHKARMQAILGTAVDGMVTINEQGIIESFNPAAERIFGYRAEEVIGETVGVLMPSPHRERHKTYLNRYLETGVKKIIGQGREVAGLRKDGTIFPMELSVSEAQWDDNRIFTGVIKDITRRRELEREVLKISEDERQRIGQDLHDGLGQMLTGMGLIAQNVARKLEANGLPGAEEVREVSEMIRQADEHARSLARGLVHVDLETNGLTFALKKLCSRAERMFGIDCSFSGDEETEVGGYVQALNMYRIAQEAVNNAVKHGNASRIGVGLRRENNHIFLEVEDNGVGFDAEKDREESKGMGIRIMQYRSGIMNGHLEIRRTPAEITKVKCIIPAND